METIMDAIAGATVTQYVVAGSVIVGGLLAKRLLAFKGDPATKEVLVDKKPLDYSSTTIQLHGAPSIYADGISSASPFVGKLELFLRVNKIPYKRRGFDYSKAPNGKMPYIQTADGKLMGDSSFIMLHLEKSFEGKLPGSKLLKDLDPVRRGANIAVMHMVEDSLYFGIVAERWLQSEPNWKLLNKFFLSKIPFPLSLVIPNQVRNQVRSACHGHGLARLSHEDQFFMHQKTIDAIVDVLGKDEFLGGDGPTIADCTTWAHLHGIINAPFADSKLRDYVKSKPTLVDYVNRIVERYYPEAKKE